MARRGSKASNCTRRAPLAAGHAVSYLVDTLSRAAPNSVTLCALGPLTNIATALVERRRFAPRCATSC